MAAQFLLVLQGCLSIGGIQRTEGDQAVHQSVRRWCSSVGGDSDRMEHLLPAEPGHLRLGRQFVVRSAGRLCLSASDALLISYDEV